MTDISQLLPCPFCGGRPLIDDTDDGGSFIECAKCGASSAVHYDRMENLIPSWNRRVIDVDSARHKKKQRAKRLASEAQSHQAKLRRMLRNGEDIG